MRKITSTVVESFLNRRSIRIDNTHTDGTTLYLHGNPIAKHTPEGLEITNAGWFSSTTKERLNALPGVRIQQKAGTWYLNGNEWDGKKTIIDTSRHSL